VKPVLPTDPFLNAVSPARRRELLSEATTFLKTHGTEGKLSDPTIKPKMDRATRRRAMKGYGWRGTKAKRHLTDERIPLVATAFAIDASLTEADRRMQMSMADRLRLKIRERAAS
jgi:hypothetical protein